MSIKTKKAQTTTRAQLPCHPRTTSASRVAIGEPIGRNRGKCKALSSNHLKLYWPNVYLTSYR